MAKKSKPVRKTAKPSVRKGTAKKKSAAKRITGKKRIPKKKSVPSKTTTKKKAVAKKRTVKKTVPNKKSVTSKAAIKKPAANKTARPGGKTTPKKARPASKRKANEPANDMKTTLRTLTEESVVQPPVEEQPVTPVVKINEPENTDAEPTPWVKVEDHITVEDNNKAQEEFYPAEPKPFDKFTPKAAPQEKLHFSSKPKGSIKPAGKKPLWNK